MPRLRNVEDQVIDVDDADVDFYAARGWTPETVDTQLSGLERAAAAPGDSGIIGTIDAAATSALSGATLGLSDVVASSLSTTNTRDMMRRNREDNALVSGVANFAGSLAPALVNPASLLGRTPAGLLGNASTKLYTAGRELGGVRGAITSIGAGAVEGAISNAGSYLAEVALADKDVTAEGLSAALGNGFAFGGALGGAALGIESGTIAARKLFARAPDVSDEAAEAAAAAGEWERKSTEMLTAHEQAAEAARRQLDEARVARETAALAKKTAASKIAEAKAALAREMPEEQIGIPLFDDLASGKATPERVIPYEEIAERGWSTPAGRSVSDDMVSRYRQQIDNGELPTVSIAIARNNDVVVMGANAEIMEAARQANSPIAVRFERTNLDEAPTTWPNGKPAFLKRGAAVDAENELLESLKAKIAAQEIEGELGPFTPEGLEAAARRTMKRQAAREGELAAAVNEFDDAKRALDEMKARIAAREVEGEIGPFTPAGLEAAAQRELARRAAAPPPPAGPPPAAVADAAPVVAGGKPGRVRVRKNVQASGKSLEELLQETANKMGEGATLKDLQAVAAAPRRTSELAEEIDEAAAVMTRYERAAAAISDIAGDAAPAAAKESTKAFRDAEAAADAQMLGSASQALDDAADMGPSPAKITYRESLARRTKFTQEKQDAIRQAQIESADADVALAKLRVAETEAEQIERKARGELRKTKAEIKAKQPEIPDPYGDMDIDIPLLSSVPVVGPFLQSFLKYRSARAASKGGRVPITAKGKIAAFAAKARNTVFDAVDKSLGVVQSGAAKAPKGIRPLTSAGAVNILDDRAFDDGEPDAEEKANLQQKAAVRMREVAFAATNPQAVALRVRRELRGISDPRLIEATIKHQVAKYQYLNDIAPKMPPPNPYSVAQWVPSTGAALKWGRCLAVANDPMAAFEALEQRCLTPEAADTLRKIYPRIFADAQQRLVARAGDIKQQIPYQQLLQNSMLFDVPLGPSMEPQNMKLLASAHASTGENEPVPQGMGPGPAMGGAPSAPPVPSISGNTNLTSLFQTASDRRAMR